MDPSSRPATSEILLDSREVSTIKDCLALLQGLDRFLPSSSLDARRELQRLELRLLFLFGLYLPLPRPDRERLSYLQNLARAGSLGPRP